MASVQENLPGDGCGRWLRSLLNTEIQRRMCSVRPWERAPGDRKGTDPEVNPRCSWHGPCA